MSDQSPTPSKSQRDLEREREAEDALRRVHLGSETIGSSSHIRSGSLPQEDGDRIEVWGRWIGRSLGFVAVLLILWQLAELLLRAR